MLEPVIIGDATLWHGDCLEVMARMPENSIAAIVCDPPYLLNFMGKAFDKQHKELPGANEGQKMQAWHARWVAEAFRILKPGGYIAAFGGDRTHHRLMAAMEDAGFELRQNLYWCFGSGFPKNQDASKAIDKIAPRLKLFAPFAKHYADRRIANGMTHAEVCEAGGFYENHNHGGASVNWENGYNVPTLAQWKILQPLLGLSHEWLPLIERIEAERDVIGRRKVVPGVAFNCDGPNELPITAPATEAARKWEGWGSALKPSVEPICCARKPMIGTLAENLLAWGCGALNIDATRVPGTPEATRFDPTKHGHDGWRMTATGEECAQRAQQTTGRYPAHLLHDGSEEVVAMFPTTGPSKATMRGLLNSGRHGGLADIGENIKEGTNSMRGHEDNGGSAARFFQSCPYDAGDHDPLYYSGKASKRDRDEGCGFDMPLGPPPASARSKPAPGRENALGNSRRNHHCSVKPTSLMRWLVRLFVPPGETVLDPFMGSGSTLKAALLENKTCIGIEMDPEYFAIAVERIKHVSPDGFTLESSL